MLGAAVSRYTGDISKSVRTGERLFIELGIKIKKVPRYTVGRVVVVSRAECPAFIRSTEKRGREKTVKSTVEEREAIVAKRAVFAAQFRVAGWENKPGRVCVLSSERFAGKGEKKHAVLLTCIITRSEARDRVLKLRLSKGREAFVGNGAIFEDHVSRAVDKMRH